MKKIIIEDAQVDVGGSSMISCGAPDIVAEVRIRDEDGDISWYGLVEYDSMPNFYESDKSIFEDIICNQRDPEEPFPAAEFYEDYSEFYEDLKEIARTDEAHALLLRYLVCLARADWDEVDELKKATVGKALGDFEIPTTDAEEEYLEEQEEE